MKRMLLLVIMCSSAFWFLGGTSVQNTLTSEQVITSANLARQDIRSGEVLFTASGYNAPSRTLVEAQKWLEEQKADLRKEIKNGAKAGAPHLADEAGRERFYKFRSEMFAEMFQFDVDSRPFDMQKQVAFVIQQESRGQWRIAGNIQCRLINVDRQPRDLSKPYDIPDYTTSVYNGSIEQNKYEHRHTPFDFDDVRPMQEPSTFDKLHLWGHGVFAIPQKDVQLLGQEVVDNVNCYTIAFQMIDIPFASAKIPLRITYWIAPEYGFRTVAEEYVLHEDDSQSTIYVTVKNRDFREFAGIWYPTAREVIEYFPTGSRKGQIRSETLFNVKHATFNVSFPKDFFKVSETPHQHDDEDTNALGSKTPQRALLECGPRSLLIACQILGIDAQFSELTEASDFSEMTGTTMAGLYKAAAAKRLNPVGVRTTLADLYQLEMPVIAHVNEDHFLVVTQANPGQIRLRDPIQRYSALSPEEFEKIWNGALLIFTLDRAGVAPSSVQNSTRSLPLQVNERTHHFGEAFGGQELKHIFTFTNTGTDPVQIIEVQSSCNCTTAFLSDKNIASGQDGQIEVTLKVPSKNEKVEERVLLHTNSTRQPTIEFSIAANALLPLVPIPEQIALGRFSPDTFKAKTFILRQAFDRHVQILSVTTDSDYFAIENETDPATGNLSGAIHVKPGIPIGAFSHLLKVDFVLDDQKGAMTIPILGEVLGDFNVFPRHLFFGNESRHERDLIYRNVSIDIFPNEPELLQLKIHWFKPEIEVSTLRSRGARVSSFIKFTSWSIGGQLFQPRLVLGGKNDNTPLHQ